jgi:hypothetical protein
LIANRHRMGHGGTATIANRDRFRGPVNTKQKTADTRRPKTDSKERHER